MMLTGAAVEPIGPDRPGGGGVKAPNAVRSKWERFGSALGTVATVPDRKRVIGACPLAGFGTGTGNRWWFACRNTVPVEQLVSSEVDGREEHPLRKADQGPRRPHPGFEREIQAPQGDLERVLPQGHPLIPAWWSK